MSQPPISVLLPVHDGERYLRFAIESILAQSCGDFELLVLDDASTDGSREIATSIRDDRVRVVSNPDKSPNLASVLNVGLGLAQGEFIARMDADDASEPQRFAVQLDFLRTHPDVGVVGSWASVIDSAGAFKFVVHPPTLDAAIRFVLNFRCPVLHPSIMVRRAVIEDVGGYDERMDHAEDYDLYARIALRTKIANIDQHLIAYREHDASVSAVGRGPQHDFAHRVSQRLITDLLGRPAPVDEILALRTGQPRTKAELRRASRLLVRLYLAARDAPSYADAASRGVLRGAAVHELLSLGQVRLGRTRAITPNVLAYRVDPAAAGRFHGVEIKELVQKRKRRS